MSDEERARALKNAEDAKEEAEAARQMKLEAVRALIEDMKITCSDTMPKPLTPGTVMKSKIEVETNLFGIRIDEDYVIYKYDISMSHDTGRKIIEFTRKGRTDHVVTDRLHTCMLIFARAIKLTGNYSDDLVFFYDGQSIMYSTQKLAFHPPHTRSCEITLDGATISQSLEFFKEITFVIKECKDRFQSRLSDMRRVDRDMVTKDRTAMQFVDVATSMFALTQCDSRFTIFANGKIFPTRPDLEGIQTVSMKEGKMLIPGMSKSIKLVEGPRGRDHASPALAVDSLRAVFHVKGSLVEKARGCFVDLNRPTVQEINAFATMVRELGCMTTHMRARQRRVEIHAISRDSALSFKMDVAKPGEATNIITVAHYFSLQYGLELRFPGAPLIMARERGKMNMYPMEVLEVIAMQRVTIPQTTSAQSQVATKECAVPPGTRQNAIVAQCELHDMFNPEQQFLKAAGIGVIAHPLRVSGRVLKAPVLQYKRNEMEVMQPAWRPPQNHQFAIPSTCERWAMYAILNPNDNFGVNDVRKFADAFVKSCKARGMQINQPNVSDLVPFPPQGKSPDFMAREKIKEAAFHKCSLVFFITSDNITIHHFLKLQETYSTMLTQDCKLKTAVNFMQKNQSLTMDNIVAKTNVKLGGLNYGISLKNVVGGQINPFVATRLIVGIGLSHAPPAPTYMSATGVKLESPTVVGYSANMGNTPTEYIGDFLYQESKKDDLLLCTTEMMNNILDRFTGLVKPDGTRVVLGDKEAPPKPLPKELIVYRQGVAEGFYSMCIGEEIPLLKAVLASRGVIDCKVTYIIVQKEHNVRLMPININTAERATQQNIGSGVCIDSQLTHPRNREFFLNSHLTLQGTARTPRYTVLHDDQDLSMNELESLTHALAFNFQIVNSPISLPTPLYVANRYAERGVALFTAKITDEMATSEQKVRTSLAEMTEDLGYARKNLGAFRINA